MHVHAMSSFAPWTLDSRKQVQQKEFCIGFFFALLLQSLKRFIKKLESIEGNGNPHREPEPSIRCRQGFFEAGEELL